MDAAEAVKPSQEAEVFWNLPNSITMLRIAVVPVLLVIPFATSRWASSVIAWCFIVAAASDVVDGYFARRGGQVTRIGILLDPQSKHLVEQIRKGLSEFLAGHHWTMQQYF